MMKGSQNSDFFQKWTQLSEVSDRIFRRGFDRGRRLIAARHEIRGLACHRLDEAGRHVVVAGDKRGGWYAAELDFGDTAETAVPFVTLQPPPPPSPPADGDRVIDDVQIVQLGPANELAVLLATRGNGAWIAPLAPVLAELRHLRSTTEKVEVPLALLPESAGRRVRSLVYDQPSRTMLGLATNEERRAGGSSVVRNELFCWSLAEEAPAFVSREEFPCALNAAVIDRGEPGDADDLLYIATGRFELFSFVRPAPGAQFVVTSAALEAKAEAKEMVWEGRLSPILRMRPLSDVGYYADPERREWHRTFSQRGVVAMTLRHLLLIYEPSESDRGKNAGTPISHFHARLVVGETKNLDLAILNFPEKDEDLQSNAGWHGVAVSTLEGKIRIFRPSGIRRPKSGGFGLFRRDAPEVMFPTHLISGYKDLPEEVVQDQVYSIETLSPPGIQGSEIGVVFGRGDNEVWWHRFRLRWRLREEAREIAKQLVEEAPTIDALLDTLQEIALSSRYWQLAGTTALAAAVVDPRRDKHALIEILPRLWHRFTTDDHWYRFYLLVWDILARRTPRYVAIGVIQALRRVQQELNDKLAADELLCRQAELERQILKIRKFVLDPGHFSQKRTRFLELANTQDPDLADERAIYRSILLARRHDPLFVTDFNKGGTELLGEVLAFTPLPSAAGGRFWEAPEPGQVRFVASNYFGELWLLDGEGRARCLIEETELGPIRALHVYGDALLLSFFDGQLRRLDRQRLPLCAAAPEGAAQESWQPCLEPLPEIGERGVAATAFATLPPAAGEGCGLLWGDREGRIHLLGHDAPLATLAAPSRVQPGARAVLQLAWTECAWPGGRRRAFVVAGTADGRVLLFAWERGTPPRLELCSELRFSDPIASLLVTGPERRHVVVARYDSAVGCKVLGEPEAPRLGLVWAFRTDDTVRSVQPVSPEVTGGQGPHRVLVGSHDAHLHALDLEGRHLETYSFRQDPLRRNDDPGFKVGLFVTAPPRPGEDDENVLLRVYACAFENRYVGLRLIDRPRMLEKFNRDELESAGGGVRELRLTRWRAYHLAEGHLRHRFIRQSRRYPGAEPDETLSALDWLLEAGDTSHEPTGEVTALLRRLFQNRPFAHEEPDRPQGLRRILAEPDRYRDAIVLLQELDKRWDTPNSVANQRVLLFWIRSFLREIEDRDMLRRWLAVGEEVAVAGEQLAKPEVLIRRFLLAAHRLIQYKTLQYLERTIFGWPGTREQPLFARGEVRPGDLDWLLDALFARLASRPEQVSRQQPNPVVLQIGRMLCLMVRDGHVDPLYLTYLIQRDSIDHAMYQILAEQLEALADQHGEGAAVAREAVQILHLASSLDQSLADDAPLSEIASHLRALIERPWPESHGPDADYLRQAPAYFRTILPLLEVASLQDIHQLASTGEWQPPTRGRHLSFCPSYSYLAELTPLLDAVHSYYAKKYEDQWVSPVMTHFRFADFDQVRRAWRSWQRRVESLLHDDPPALARREALLVERLLARWEEILITTEQNKNLLMDFQNTLEVHSFKAIEPIYRFDPENVKQVREEKEFAFIAFANLFNRLLLLAEPVEGVFLYRWKDGEEERIRGRCFRDGAHAPPELADLGAEQPSWMPAGWLAPATFSQLDRAQLEAHLHTVDAARVWQVETIAGTPDEKGVLAFYIFAWNDAEAAGLHRFEKQRLAWAVPLQALVYRRAAMEQVELKGRVFSMVAHNLGSPVYQMRSDLRMLLDRRLEGVSKQANRFEKYAQLLRQARHMDGIIDSVLSLADRQIELNLTEFSLALLTHEVVRTIRREARARNVQIEYPEPEQESVEKTRLYTDEPKVYDILLNLLNNAVKYSPIGEQIFVTVSPKVRGVEVQITDRGPGIPNEERRHIFDAFYRGANARKTTGGLGLGLYTAELYTKALGGYLNHKNESAGGSTFTLFLPPYRREEEERS